MAARRRRSRKSSGPKRTITPEQQAKMQAARKAKKVNEDRVRKAHDVLGDIHQERGYTQRLLDEASEARRKGRGRR